MNNKKKKKLFRRRNKALISKDSMLREKFFSYHVLKGKKKNEAQSSNYSSSPIIARHQTPWNLYYPSFIISCFCTLLHIYISDFIARLIVNFSVAQCLMNYNRILFYLFVCVFGLLFSLKTRVVVYFVYELNFIHKSSYCEGLKIV